MKLSIVEFRKQIREAFNAVERGETVYITRHNKTFELVKSPVSFLSTGEASIVLKPDIQKISPVASQHIKTASNPAAPNEFMKAVEAMPHYKTDPVPDPDSGELSCCTRTKPCQHWQWNTDISVWINSLSGRERGAE